MMQMLKSFWNDESGQGLTEYALIIGFIALAVTLLLVAFGEQLKTIYQNIVNRLGEVPSGA